MSMPEAFDAVDVIRAKRDNNRLSDPMIDWVIDAYTRGVVTSDQMAALAMAIFLNGMSREEIVTWTTAMMNSGIRMNFDSLGRPTADKHSTGGVGDKITLPLAPLVAVFGVAVPQLSGRGLGHTGGTLDKMESIKGWQAEVSDKQMMEMLGQNGPGAVICAASADLAPADKKLYALRDVTATVDCIPLIASSIMSKKIAEGTDSLVLDVKVGSGAFMKDQAQARALAETMVALGTDAGVRTSALLTNMSTPLGLMIGNALEVQESIEILAGGGPSDVVDLTVLLAEEMLRLAGKPDEDVRAALNDGRAMDHWRAMVKAQHGDLDAPMPKAKHSEVIYAESDGYVETMDAWGVGICAWRLGAGRTRQGEKLDLGAGVQIHAKPGDYIKKGSPLLTLFTDTPEKFARSIEALEGAIEIGIQKPTNLTPLVLDRIDAK